MLVHLCEGQSGAQLSGKKTRGDSQKSPRGDLDMREDQSKDF